MNNSKPTSYRGLTRISADQEKRIWEFSYDASINVSAMKTKQNQFALIRADQCSSAFISSKLLVFAADLCLSVVRF
jgi:hypothetical protein